MEALVTTRGRLAWDDEAHQCRAETMDDLQRQLLPIDDAMSL